jgi:hypothetical protein
MHRKRGKQTHILYRKKEMRTVIMNSEVQDMPQQNDITNTDERIIRRPFFIRPFFVRPFFWRPPIFWRPPFFWRPYFGNPFLSGVLGGLLGGLLVSTLVGPYRYVYWYPYPPYPYYPPYPIY